MTFSKSLTATIAAGSMIIATAGVAQARDQINIVGSSTVFPFATAVAEQFGNKSEFKAPKVESTGSGGGLKLFCKGVGAETPDITNASRRMKAKEYKLCQDGGVKDIVEFKLGFDGIAMANAQSGPSLALTRKQVYLALAKEVPDPAGGEKVVANPYQKWSDVDPSLPDMKIEVLGPPPTSGTRDAFEELAIEGGCKSFGFLKAMKKADKKRYRQFCRHVREDGAYVEAGENDNLIVSKLEANPKAVGVFGYSFLEQNADKVKGATIDGVAPEFEAISSGEYPVSRSLWMYVKKAHIGVIPGLQEYAQEWVADGTFGDEGYLVEKGLIPLPKGEREATVAKATSLATMDGSEKLK
ncbi:MAG: substrate-binding domain-containing protein [Pseudomonadota bacterium]